MDFESDAKLASPTKKFENVCDCVELEQLRLEDAMNLMALASMLLQVAEKALKCRRRLMMIARASLARILESECLQNRKTLKIDQGLKKRQLTRCRQQTVEEQITAT